MFIKKIEVGECKVIEVEQDPTQNVATYAPFTQNHQNLVNKLANNHPSNRRLIRRLVINAIVQSINKYLIKCHKKMKKK